MFYLHTIKCNIKRNKFKSMITISICIFVILLLNLYMKNMKSTNEQLTNLSSITTIYCRITNLNGSLETGLEISEDLVDNLMSSNQIEDTTFAIRLMAGEGGFNVDDWKENLTILVAGTNKITGIAGLSLENIHMNEKAVTNFFSSFESICLVSETVMEKHKWNIGDIVTLNLYYLYYDDRNQLHYEPLELTSVKILGTMDTINSSTEQIPPDILLPFESIRKSFHQQQVPFMVESASFNVADPLKLNDFKEEMKSFGLMQKLPTADQNYQGIALTVRDTTFRTLASQLRQSIDTLQGFFPLISITIVCIGYITSFLLINSRKKEFALMRAIGVGKGSCFGLFLIEQLVLILIGEVIGGVVAIFLFRSGVVIVEAGALFFISYLLGCIVALWRMGRISVIEALFSAE